MKTRSSRTTSPVRDGPPGRKTSLPSRMLGPVVSLIVLIFSAAPAEAVSRIGRDGHAPHLQSSTLTFPVEADARVQQSSPSSNYGTATYLQVDSGASTGTESLLRFTVSGLSGPVESARVRIYVTSNSSTNSPAIHATDTNWTETAVTWNNRPGRTSGVLDNLGATAKNSWVEYNVSAAVTGNGTYAFVLVADSIDAIRFSSREGAQDPQLVLTVGSAAPTATRTFTTAPSQTASQAPPATATASRTPTAAATATNAAVGPLTFLAAADARVSEASPGSNYGTATTLQSDGDAGTRQTSFIRFTVSGISGSIQSARLRVFCTTNGTTNGPAVHLASSTWTESGTGGITWDNQPALQSAAYDNKGAFSSNSWVEYDVSVLVTGNGTYTFALVADGTDGVVFSSREGTAPPQLVLTPGAGAPTASVTQPLAISTNTPTLTLPPPTATRTPTAPAASTATAPATNTAVSGNQLITVNPVADSFVEAANPATNYGTQTQLRGDGSPVIQSYLRFTVQDLTGPVTRATLRMFANTASSGGYEIRSVSNTSWGETSITYNNAPAPGPVLGSSGAFSAATWTEVDVTAHITGNGTYSLALTVPGTTAISFASREVGNNAPQLVVESQGGAAVTATRTATAVNTPTATRTPTRTATAVNTSTATRTPTRTPTPLNTPTVTRTPSRTPTTGPTASGSVVLVGAGDIANCNRTQDEQTAQLLDNIPGTVFTTGDNAYVNGTYTEFINCYEPNWGRHKSRTMPSPGNHDYLTTGAAGYFQYFNNIPSYYAYDLGAWRIYSLNSEISASATSPQATWLRDDLAQNPRQCVAAYWHKPRWSSGSNHGDNSPMQPIWQILYDAGADLVLNGHEHNYERFAQMDAAGAEVSQGLREIVVGTGGASLYPFGTPLPASEVRANTAHGVLKLTLYPNSYDWEFIPVPGATFTDSGSTNCH